MKIVGWSIRIPRVILSLLTGCCLGLSGALTDFALPLFIGILSGTYSSIFVTIPFLSKIIKN